MFGNALKGKPRAKVELLYQKDDLESYDFATKIKRALDDAGWTTIGVRPILESDALYPASPPVQMPLIVRAGGGLAGGIGIISRNPPETTTTESPADALMNALSLAGLKNGHPAQKTFRGTVDPRLSDDDLLKL